MVNSLFPHPADGLRVIDTIEYDPSKATSHARNLALLTRNDLLQNLFRLISGAPGKPGRIRVDKCTSALVVISEVQMLHFRTAMLKKYKSFRGAFDAMKASSSETPGVVPEYIPKARLVSEYSAAIKKVLGKLYGTDVDEVLLDEAVGPADGSGGAAGPGGVAGPSSAAVVPAPRPSKQAAVAVTHVADKNANEGPRGTRDPKPTTSRRRASNVAFIATECVGTSPGVSAGAAELRDPAHPEPGETSDFPSSSEEEDTEEAEKNASLMKTKIKTAARQRAQAGRSPTSDSDLDEDALDQAVQDVGDLSEKIRKSIAFIPQAADILDAGTQDGRASLRRKSVMVSSSAAGGGGRAPSKGLPAKGPPGAARTTLHANTSANNTLAVLPGGGAHSNAHSSSSSPPGSQNAGGPTPGPNNRLSVRPPGAQGNTNRKSTAAALASQLEQQVGPEALRFYDYVAAFGVNEQFALHPRTANIEGVTYNSFLSAMAISAPPLGLGGFRKRLLIRFGSWNEILRMFQAKKSESQAGADMRMGKAQAIAPSPRLHYYSGSDPARNSSMQGGENRYIRLFLGY